MQYIFPLPTQVSVEVADTDMRFPVRRIFCVGRNYEAHAREMDPGAKREPPFFFTKPADAIVADRATVPYPSRTKDFHHEIELVVAIDRAGREIPVARAGEHILGYAVGIDLTRRDLQSEARKEGRPWDLSKGFDYSAPISSIQSAVAVGHVARGRIWLKVNGSLRQDADVSEMISNVPELIAELSTFFELRPGDLIYTGTPAGVGPLKPGDHVEGGIDRVGTITITIGSPIAGPSTGTSA
jgi:fumarylpyruvate hydrolase